LLLGGARYWGSGEIPESVKRREKGERLDFLPGTIGKMMRHLPNQTRKKEIKNLRGRRKSRVQKGRKREGRKSEGEKERDGGGNFIEGERGLVRDKISKEGGMRREGGGGWGDVINLYNLEWKKTGKAKEPKGVYPVPKLDIGYMACYPIHKPR